jgi:hypothetical protein
MNGFMTTAMALLGVTILGGATWAGAEAAPTREEAQQAADAMRVVNAVRQTGQAVQAAKLTQGRVHKGMAGVDMLVSSGWMKSVPANPTDPQPAGAAVRREIGGVPVVGMRLVEDGRAVCDEVSSMIGNRWPAPISDVPTGNEGCVITSSGPVAFVRV